MKRKPILLLAFILFAASLPAQSTSWPETSAQTSPGTRWWWLGSAVDKQNLTYNIAEYARAGIGAVEITPIYGVQKNERNDIPFLSEKWMEMLRQTVSETKINGMQTDMNTGTGWPFGGPGVSVEDAASKLLTNEYSINNGGTFSETIAPQDKSQKDIAKLSRVMAYGPKNQIIDLTAKVDAQGKLTWKAPAGDWKIIAAFCGKTMQKVKRAAPGGEGLVMDHFSKRAVKNYLDHFEKAFSSTNTAYPQSFFNDSYEVYGADWTEDFFEQFYARRGYKLENHLPAFLSKERNDITARIISDYRQTISDLLLENFTQQWTNWAHAHGSKTRNQAHGSPGNLIDLYATVDIPECEGFGMTEFGIKGLRKDSLVRKNDSDISMLKYASSAAHIAGKPLVSSETFTWLTEHFRTSLSQCKPDLDLLFAAGINNCYFHGTTYSPREAEWPGWKFYASVDMSPTNTIWRDAPAMFSYITRCQSFLQMGKPDNEFLIYLPLYDIWHEQKGRFLTFTIHDMEKLMPQFIHVVQSIYNSGFDVDYISDEFIRGTKFIDGKLQTSGGARYEALILPGVKKMPHDVLAHIVKLTEQGAKIVVINNYPEDVPGFGQLQSRRSALKKALKKLIQQVDFDKTTTHSLKKGKVITGNHFEETLAAVGKQPEELTIKFGFHTLRRSNADGYHYFIASLQEKDVDSWVTLSTPAQSAMIFDPMTGNSGKASMRQQNGRAQVYVQLKSGASLILKTFVKEDVNVPAWVYLQAAMRTVELNAPWTLRFDESTPRIAGNFQLDKPKAWTDMEIPNGKINRGTGIYSTTFNVDAINESDEWVLNLGDVRESASVLVNGQPVATLWAVPFECHIGKYIKKGENTLQIEVTNLPANAIAEMDRQKTEWRIFKEINFVDRNYKTTGYGHWQTMPSGLAGPVKLSIHSKFRP